MNSIAQPSPHVTARKVKLSELITCIEQMARTAWSACAAEPLGEGVKAVTILVVVLVTNWQGCLQSTSARTNHNLKPLHQFLGLIITDRKTRGSYYKAMGEGNKDCVL